MKKLLLLLIATSTCFAQNPIFCDENEALMGVYKTELGSSRGDKLLYMVNFSCGSNDELIGSFIRYDENAVAFRVGIFQKMEFIKSEKKLIGEIITTNDRNNPSNRGNRIKFELIFNGDEVSYNSFDGFWSTIKDGVNGPWTGVAINPLNIEKHRADSRELGLF